LASTSCSGSAVRAGGDGSASTDTVSATDRVRLPDAPPKSTVTCSPSELATVPWRPGSSPSSLNRCSRSSASFSKRSTVTFAPGSTSASGTPAIRWPGSIGWPCGQVFASPIAASMRASSTGDIACSSRSASSCTSSQGMPSTSVRKRSMSRWRRTIASAWPSPSVVKEIDLSAARVM
jgi:hypothetical protein